MKWWNQMAVSDVHLGDRVVNSGESLSELHSCCWSIMIKYNIKKYNIMAAENI